jgi:hypothetical protein
MDTPLSSFGLILSGLSLFLAPAWSQDQLSGRWRSTEVSPAGVSAVFEFHNDHQLDSYSAIVSESKYRLAGTDTILLQLDAGREEKQELEWDNQDRARIEDEAVGKSIELIRIGRIPDRKNPLVGEWSTMREWKGSKYPARALFHSDGKVIWLITLRTEHGRYSTQTSNIRLEIAGRPSVEGVFTLSENRLILPNPKGGGSSFDRF